MRKISLRGKLYSVLLALALLTGVPAEAHPGNLDPFAQLRHLTLNTNELVTQVRLMVRENPGLFQLPAGPGNWVYSPYRVGPTVVHRTYWQGPWAQGPIPYVVERWGWFGPRATTYLARPFFEGIGIGPARVARLLPRHPEYIKQEIVRRFNELAASSADLERLYRTDYVNWHRTHGARPWPQAAHFRNVFHFNVEASLRNSFAIASVLHAAVYELLYRDGHPYVYPPGVSRALQYRLGAIQHYLNQTLFLVDRIQHDRAYGFGVVGNCFAAMYPPFAFHFNANHGYRGPIGHYPVAPLYQAGQYPRVGAVGHAAHVELEYSVEGWRYPAPEIASLRGDDYLRGYIGQYQVERRRQAGVISEDPWYRGQYTREQALTPGYLGPQPGLYQEGSVRRFQEEAVQGVVPGTGTPQSIPGQGVPQSIPGQAIPQTVPGQVVPGQVVPGNGYRGPWTPGVTPGQGYPQGQQQIPGQGYPQGLQQIPGQVPGQVVPSQSSQQDLGQHQTQTGQPDQFISPEEAARLMQQQQQQSQPPERQQQSGPQFPTDQPGAITPGTQGEVPQSLPPLAPPEG